MMQKYALETLYFDLGFTINFELTNITHLMPSSQFVIHR